MFQAGQQIGVYTLIGKLGRGGFGEVWLAEKRSQFVSKKVAVKLPHVDQVNFDAIRQEATLWEQASGHPNVLPIIDADVYDGQVVIVSEYANSGSLADRLKREGKLSVQQAVEMTIGVLSGLEFLHGRQIIHRDIKPANILLQGDTPRLADFGISRAMNATMVSSTIIGTDAYMSPESFDGIRNVRTDIWSVGVVLYQLLKGSLPFPQDHPTERMFAVLTKDIEPLNIEIPWDLRGIVQKSLAKSPDQRFQTTTEMREGLQKVLLGIAHPTFAQTEVFRNPPQNIQQNIQSNIPPTISGNLPQNIQGNNPPITNGNGNTGQPTTYNPTPNVHPQTTQPAFQPQSVVTNLKPLNFAETNKPVKPIEAYRNDPPENIQLPGNARRLKSGLKVTEWAIAALVGLVLFFGITIVGWKIFGPSKKPLSVLYPGKRFAVMYPHSDSSGKYGYVDENSDYITLPKYDKAFSMNEDMGMVYLNGKYGFVDRTGTEVAILKYDSANSFSQGLAQVKQNGKYGFIDKTGKEVIPLIYDTATDFSSNGLATVTFNGRTFSIDKTGKEPYLSANSNVASNSMANYSNVASNSITRSNANTASNASKPYNTKPASNSMYSSTNKPASNYYRSPSYNTAANK